MRIAICFLFMILFSSQALAAAGSFHVSASAGLSYLVTQGAHKLNNKDIEAEMAAELVAEDAQQNPETTIYLPEQAQ